MNGLILASKSAVRSQLMQAAGLAFEVKPAPIDERRIEDDWLAQGGAGDDVPRVLAERKAAVVSHAHPNALVIGADQALFVEPNRPLSKVSEMAEAADRLRSMRERTHRLITGAAIVRDGDLLASTLETTTIVMRAISDAEIDAYLERAGASVLGSVACYQLEGLGLSLIERIDGDYSAALGLPMLWLLNELRTRGVNPLAPVQRDDDQ